MPARNQTINLLTQDEFSNSGLGKVLLWALSIGRYIVVFTELIVILSFLSRFKLDRDLTDLNEEIGRQKAIILSYGDLEDQFRQTQAQLSLVRAARDQNYPDNLLEIIKTSLPPDIKIQNLTLNPTSLSFSATALSPQSFSAFIKRLHQEPTLTDINLSSLTSKEGNAVIEFTVAANISKNSKAL